MPRPSRTVDELRKAAVAVDYEFAMLVFSAQHLSGWHSSPMTIPAGSEMNMALESFLLHFRNLREFLCPSMLREDDVLASDFLGLYDGSDVGDRNTLHADKKRLDKMLAHISYSRADYIHAGDHRWNSSTMLVLMQRELQKFVARLPTPQRTWFPSVGTP
jgi:hypothetical protein